MQRFASLLFLLIGLLLVAVLLEAGKAKLSVASRDVPADGEVALRPSLSAAPPVIEPEKPVRAIAPQIFVPPFGREATGLERLPARAPLSPPKVKEVPQGLLLARPGVERPGVIAFAQGAVTLEGLEPMDRDRTCTSAGGGDWPCGMMALTALRRFLRGRAVFCSITDPEWRGEVEAGCLLGTQDVAAWLALNGWAEAQPGSGYADLSHEAAKARRGIFGDDPRSLE